MDRYVFFAVVSVALTIPRYGTYLHTIYQGKTKPHAFTWFSWGLITGIGAFAQFDLHGGPSAWALAFLSITCLLISALGLLIGERDYAKSDWFALVGCFIAIVLWKTIDNPAAAILTIIVIDWLTYWPAFDTANKPGGCEREASALIKLTNQSNPARFHHSIIVFPDSLLKA